jgi:putative membrane-bound dehydrogenase-like protein
LRSCNAQVTSFNHFIKVHMMRPTDFILTVALLFFNDAIRAAEPTVDAKDLPRIPAVEPAQAIGTIHVRKGLSVELAACEPQVSSPVAMSFDENGRLFVVEMPDYPDHREQHIGRIKLLEDTHGNGVYDKATIYADGLQWPTGVICYDGGIFVAASPDILYLKDTKSDGVADVKKVVFTGFGAAVPRLNVQALPNSFNWGLDNRIHGATSMNGGSVTCPSTPAIPALNLRGQDFSFDPRTLAIRAESGGGQYGMSFDTTGRKFVCSNSHHIQMLMYEARYAARNPSYAMPSPLVDIAADGPAAEIYRISPDEAWRVIRTKWRVAGLASGPIEGGGRVSGYFSGATGITLYRGNALPVEFLDNAFVGDAGGNLVHRKLLRPDGVGVAATRPVDEQKSEFLASRDNWFRPVQLANGPDGALYVIDMYREVIEHPWSLPDSIKEHLDLYSGSERGRIYRIVPEHFSRPAPPRLGSATTAELAALLEHSNGWQRETASRLLYQRQDQSAVESLAELLEHSQSHLGRLHALHVLDGLGALKESHVLLAMLDADAAVREHAVLLSEKFLREGHAWASLWVRLEQLPADPSIRVRYQLAFTLGETDQPRKVRPLAEIAKRDAADRWVRSAILNSIAGRAVDLFSATSATPEIRGSEGGRELLRQLTLLIGARNIDADVTSVVSFLDSSEVTSDPALGFTIADALATGSNRGGKSSDPLRKRIKPLLDRARIAALNDATDQRLRVEAIGLLGAISSDESRAILFSLLEANKPQEIQSAALAALDRSDQRDVAAKLLKRFASLSPKLRSEALAVLLKRPDRALALMHGIEAGDIRLDTLSTTQKLLLKNHRDPKVSSLAKKIFDQHPVAQREEVIRASLPALELHGQADKGKAIYQQRCAACHRSGGEGFAVGPDFTSIKDAGKEKNLVNILDPNREVAPNYLSYLVETKSGETLIGLIAGESTASVTIRQAYGKEVTVLRADLRRMENQKLSLMPEGVETGLSTQDLADLLEYIATAKSGP